MGSCASCCRKRNEARNSYSYSTLGSLTLRGTGTAFSTQNLQLCQGCRVPWNNETSRAGPCDRCIVRQKDRCSLIEEFLQTEIIYNDHLVSLREGVQKPLDSSTLLTPAEHTKIFAELKDLIYLSNRVIALLNDAIKGSIQHGDQHLERVEIGRILFRVWPHYSCFVPFVIKQETNLQVLTELESTSEDFRLLLWEADIADIGSLEKLFQKPSLRIHKLPSFVDQILEKTPLTHCDRKALQNTQQKVQELLKNIKKYSTRRTPASKERRAPPKPKRKMKKSKSSPKRSDFGKTFTKSPNKRKSLNPFDSSSSSSSEYHEVGPGDDEKTEEMKRDSLERAFQVIEKAEEVNCESLERALQVIEKGEEINCDSLERAFKDLEKSIECMEASSQVPKVALDSSAGAEKRTTNLSVVEEYSPGSPANSSFEGSLRLSPRMARATILRPRSASPRTRSFSFGRDESEAADHEYNNLWEKRSSSPGIIEYLSDRSVTKSPKVNPKKDQSLSKLDTEKVENEIGNEKETTLSAEARSVEDSPQTTSQPHTPPPDPEELLTLCKAKNTSVSSTIGDEFFFDERDFYEISDMESDTSLDEFELRSKGSELELSDLESERYWSTQKSKNPSKPIDQITEEDNSKTLTRDEADSES